ncbi:MAG: EamA family transporter RarD [Synergistaceae bacterium]|nr:EamA family transporter RarD [Synergistaceae bacterium]
MMTGPQRGALAAFLSYIWWGSMPLYWKLLQNVPSTEILSHRVLWSAVFTFVVLLLTKKCGGTLAFLRENPRKGLWLAAGGFLITINWGLYIWAINAGHILDTSLGYYINPLLSMFFGVLFFGERMNRAQKAALLLAFAGVALQIATLGEIPFVAFGLALSFALYGVLKKKIPIEPPSALFIETISVAPAALLWLYFIKERANVPISYDTVTFLLLAGTGIATSVPLFLFAYGAGKVRLTTIGFIQYVSPTMAFIIGTLVYHEPLNICKIITFCCIWCAIALYSADLALSGRGADEKG